MNRALRGFTLVEVTIALGVTAFCLVAIVALLPLGLKANQSSAEETRAVCILANVELDVRNTYGTSAARTSVNYGLPVPYIAANPGEPMKLDYSLAPGPHSIWLNEDETRAVSPAQGRYQVTLFYTVPAAGTFNPAKAHLIVSWPCLPLSEATPAALTNSSRVAGFVESYVTFPAP